MVKPGRPTTAKEPKRKPTDKEERSRHYKDLEIPNGAVVYLDPPYEGRTKAYQFDDFDYQAFWRWVRELSKRCTVFTSCFDCPPDFKTVYEWGDTVHRYTDGKRQTEYSDGTNERLVKYDEGFQYWRVHCLCKRR